MDLIEGNTWDRYIMNGLDSDKTVKSHSEIIHMIDELRNLEDIATEINQNNLENFVLHLFFQKVIFLLNLNLEIGE